MPRIPVSNRNNTASVSRPNLVDVNKAGESSRQLAGVVNQITEVANSFSAESERSAAIDYVNTKSLEYDRRAQKTVLETKAQFMGTDHADYAPTLANKLEDLEVELFNQGPNKLGQQQFVQSIQGTKTKEV